MDVTDEKILAALKQNGRASASEIGRKVSLSVPAVLDRIRKLEESGVIEAYTVRINREKLDYKLLAFIFVNIDQSENIGPFRKAIVQYPNVLECHHIAGEYDYLLKVLAKDPKSLEYFLSEQLKKIKGVQKSNTVITLSSVKEEINL